MVSRDNNGVITQPIVNTFSIAGLIYDQGFDLWPEEIFFVSKDYEVG